MECENVATSSVKQLTTVNAETLTRQQLQSQQQHLQLQEHQREQQQLYENQQQFCLRWHNHQTSLLSTLPTLFDQCQLTDVAIYAEGRTLHAHRVVLSACSAFFMELFRTLETSNQTVIIIPGATFASTVALLNFMYSGEVNVYEDQIPVLLNLAETLGVKGLTDVQNNLQKSTNNLSRESKSIVKQEIEKPSNSKSEIIAGSGATKTARLTSQTPPNQLTNTSDLSEQSNLLTGTPLAGSQQSTSKLPLPLENWFLKSLQLYPNLLPHPLNFSSDAISKTSELLAKYQQQYNLYQGALGLIAGNIASAQHEKEQGNIHSNDQASLSSLLVAGETTESQAKRFCAPEKRQKLSSPLIQQQQQQQQQHHDFQQKSSMQRDSSRNEKTGATTNFLEKSRDSNLAITVNSQNQQFSPSSASPSVSQQFAFKMSSPASLNPNYSSNILSKNHSMFPASTTTYLTQQQQQQLHQLNAFNCLGMEHPSSVSMTVGGFHKPFDLPLTPTSLASVLDKGIYSKDSSAKLPSPNVTETATASNLENANGTNITATNAAASPSNGPTTRATSNSKMYATCFICQKQLSNQYNLRVHLETHQNVRYACNVCSHISRSKDALRKHVSYRHPGAPSPCENEARRKRATKVSIDSNCSPTLPSVSLSAISSPKAETEMLQSPVPLNFMTPSPMTPPSALLQEQLNLPPAAGQPHQEGQNILKMLGEVERGGMVLRRSLSSEATAASGSPHNSVSSGEPSDGSTNTGNDKVAADAKRLDATTYLEGRDANANLETQINANVMQ